ncbi:MAG: hypothetical protein ACRECP_02500 [Methylocella sp.]
MWKKIWEFLLDEQNRGMLTLTGGGLAAVIVAFWTVYVHFFPAHEAKLSPPQNKIDANCGVAVGGYVSGSTITNKASAGIDCSSKER